MRKQTLLTLTLATAAGLFYARAKRAEAALLPDDKPMSPEIKEAIDDLSWDLSKLTYDPSNPNTCLVTGSSLPPHVVGEIKEERAKSGIHNPNIPGLFPIGPCRVTIPPHLVDEFKAITDDYLKKVREGKDKTKPKGFWDMFADGMQDSAKARCGINLNISHDGIDKDKVAEAVKRFNAERELRDEVPTPPKRGAGIDHVDLLRNKDGSFKVRLFTAGGLLKVAAFRIEADKVQGAPCKCADLEKLREILRPAVTELDDYLSNLNIHQELPDVRNCWWNPMFKAAKVLGIEVNRDD